MLLQELQLFVIRSFWISQTVSEFLRLCPNPNLLQAFQAAVFEGVSDLGEAACVCVWSI